MAASEPAITTGPAVVPREEDVADSALNTDLLFLRLLACQSEACDHGDRGHRPNNNCTGW